MNKKKTGMICTGLILLGILTGLGIFFLIWNRHRILTENLELAEQFLLDEDYEAAIVAFTEAIETDPRCVEAYTGLAEVYLLLGEDEKALEVIQKGQAETGNTELFAPYLEQIRNRAEAAAQLELSEDETEGAVQPEEQNEETTQPDVSEEPTELSDSSKEKIETLLKFLYYEEIGSGSAYPVHELASDEKALLLALCMSEDVYGLCTERLEQPEYSENGLPAVSEENANLFLRDCIGTDLTEYTHDGPAPLIREGGLLAFPGADWGTAYPFSRIEETASAEDGRIVLTGMVGWMGESDDTGNGFTVTEEAAFEALLEKSDSQYLDGYTLVSFQYLP